MGKLFPSDSEAQGGDEVTRAPVKGDRAILASERGTQHSKRVETDTDGNLFVHVAADDTTPPGVSPLASGSQSNVPATTLTTLVTYAAVSDVKLTKISCGGSIYAKFQLFKNTVLIDTHRSGPDRAIQLVFSPGLALTAGDVVDVKVTHYVAGGLEEFEATIYGG